VSQFYGTAYTHSLAWAVHGRTNAKKWKDKPKLLGNRLDAHVQRAQSNETLGIPIGPDTSFILGELILSAVDRQVMDAGTRRWLHGFRYYDDYELYCETRADAERARALVQSVLANWRLDLNSRKVNIRELPLPTREDWIGPLSSVALDDGSKERSSFYTLFDLAFKLAAEHPSDPVLSYALGRFIDPVLHKKKAVAAVNWRVLQDLLLQTVLAEPGTLAKVAHLLAWATADGMPLSATATANTLEAIVRLHAPLLHGNEVAWAIWTAIALQIKLSANAARLVARIPDDAVALVALDAKVKGILSDLDPKLWASLMTEDSLKGDHWLLSYEALGHRWLTTVGGLDYVTAFAPFALLRRNNVRFYDDATTMPGPTPVPLPFAPTGVVVLAATQGAITLTNEAIMKLMASVDSLEEYG
jgi:hypothetical protein